jgi:hypothetical protein|tara:strand:+ start:29 stop:259 length:231 start_codon:yes stop_codon:yes gene_type:complete
MKQIIEKLIIIIGAYISLYIICPLFGIEEKQKHKEFLKNPIVRLIAIYSYAYCATKNYTSSLLVVILFYSVDNFLN